MSNLPAGDPNYAASGPGGPLPSKRRVLPRPQWAVTEASDETAWRSRGTEIRSLDPTFAPIGVHLRQARVKGGEPQIVISSIVGDMTASLNQAAALSHRLHTLVRDAGGVA